MQKSVVVALALTLSILAACDKPVPVVPPPAVAPVVPPVAAEAPKPAATTSPLGAVSAPADNPQTDAKVALGHQLFFDKRLSKDGSRACYSCHLNEDGNGGHEALAIGAENKPLPRHSPVIWNVGYLQGHYWDGRSDTLEAQALGAWGGGNMGVGKDNLDKKAAEIAAIPGYKAAFDAVFPGETVTAQTIAKAVSAYERTLICDATAWDRFTAGDKTALDEQQQRGQTLFNGAAGCIACHTPPFFSSAYMAKPGTFFNIGIGTAGKAEKDVDAGRAAVTKADADWAAFKVPGLRNISKSAPYFHDGSVAALKDAVKLMASGGIKNKNLTPLMTDKQLTDAQIDDIVAFLGALDCNKQLEQPTLP